MKKLFLFLLLYCCVNHVNGKSLVAQAVSQAIRDFYSVHDVHFDLIVYGSKFRELNDIIDECTKPRNGELPPLYVVHLIQGKEEDVINVTRSAVLMFENLDSYKSFHKQVELNNDYPKQFHFLIYVKDLQESQAVFGSSSSSSSK